MSSLLEVRGLSKRYGNTSALMDVDLDLRPGEAVGVVGENGAGKSTLAKIMAGAVSPDGGSIRMNGISLAFRSPREARKSGIGFIPQELAFVPDLTVAENLLLNRWPSRHGLTSTSRIKREARSSLARFNVEVPLSERMSRLKLADQQIVEIVKALITRSPVLVLDEPTAALSESESEDLFRSLEALKSHGTGLLLISHRLDEVLRFCDRVDVFRSGRKVFSAATKATGVSEVVFHMLGTDQGILSQHSRVTDDRHDVPPVAEVLHWSSDVHPRLHDVSFEIRPGEIVGLFGIRGCGSETVAAGLAGRVGGINGTLRIDGKDYPRFRSPRDARKAGVSYLPPDRKHQGLILNLSIARNIGLLAVDDLSSGGVMHARRETQLAQTWSKRFDVRARNVGQRVGDLSGGNQQKVLLAGRLTHAPRLLVLQEPTRGVDIGARLQIHQYLRDLAAKGMAVLLVTADVDEAVSVSDRLNVMRAGRIARALVGDEKNAGAALREASEDAAA